MFSLQLPQIEANWEFQSKSSFSLLLKEHKRTRWSTQVAPPPDSSSTPDSILSVRSKPGVSCSLPPLQKTWSGWTGAWKMHWGVSVWINACDDSPSAPRISAGSTGTLSQMKCLLKMNDYTQFNCKLYTGHKWRTIYWALWSAKNRKCRKGGSA